MSKYGGQSELLTPPQDHASHPTCSRCASESNTLYANGDDVQPVTALSENSPTISGSPASADCCSSVRTRLPDESDHHMCTENRRLRSGSAAIRLGPAAWRMSMFWPQFDP